MLLATTACSAFAQETESVLEALSTFLEQQGSEERKGASSAGESLIVIPENFVLGEEALGAAQSAVREYYEYRVSAFKHRHLLSKWQYYSSIAIFLTVIIIVAVGIYFSWRQFHEAKNKSRLGTTKIQAGESGFSVSSPVLGVIILLISLAFFYLYLVYVYPIKDLAS